MDYKFYDKAHMITRLPRFLDKIKDYSDLNDCWIWKGAKTRLVYPKMNYRKERWYVHRWIYLLTYGELDPTLEIDHLCGNKLCVNPRHLEQVTHAINKQRGGADHRT